MDFATIRDTLASREPGVSSPKTLTRLVCVAKRPFTFHRSDDDAINGAGRHAELATGTKRWQHRMHSLGRSDDCINRARCYAQRATDAGGLVDPGDCQRPMRAARGIEWLN